MQHVSGLDHGVNDVLSSASLLEPGPWGLGFIYRGRWADHAGLEALALAMEIEATAGYKIFLFPRKTRGA